MTAVEYIEEKIKKYPELYFALCLWFDEAKEIEKKQIIDAHGNKTKKSGGISNATYILTGEEYYKEKFKNK